MWVLPVGARGPEHNTHPPRDCLTPQITVVGVTMQSLIQECDCVQWFILTRQDQEGFREDGSRNIMSVSKNETNR